MLAYNESLVRMDRAVDARTHAPAWMPDGFSKSDGAWDAAFKGYEYFYFPMDHNEFADRGVIGNPMRATVEKGNAIFDRFAGHLVEAIDELKTVQVDIKVRELVNKA
jgi:creatinine amidohydrolase